MNIKRQKKYFTNFPLILFYLLSNSRGVAIATLDIGRDWVKRRTSSALKDLLLDKQCCTRSNLFGVLRAAPLYLWVVLCRQSAASRGRWEVEQMVN